MAAAYADAATELAGKVVVGAVDCDAHKIVRVSHRDLLCCLSLTGPRAQLCKEYGIGGYPTVILFDKGSSERFANGRTKEAIVDFALHATPSAPFALIAVDPNDPEPVAPTPVAGDRTDSKVRRS